jgi:hypothetical protein
VPAGVPGGTSNLSQTIYEFGDIADSYLKAVTIMAKAEDLENCLDLLNVCYEKTGQQAMTANNMYAITHSFNDEDNGKICRALFVDAVTKQPDVDPVYTFNMGVMASQEVGSCSTRNAMTKPSDYLVSCTLQISWTTTLY